MALYALIFVINEEMNRIFFSFLFVFFSIAIQAQIEHGGYDAFANQIVKLNKMVTVDTSTIECIYQYSVIDRELQDMREYDMIMEIGDSICKYEEYNAFRLDSVLASIGYGKVTNRMYSNLSRTYDFSSTESLMENLSSNRLDFYGRVFIDNFVYHEPIPVMNWELVDSTKEVCGYLCHMATCSFRGRKWIAWYSEIPQSVGPWKLNGLPGLILEVKTTDNDHRFTAIAIRKSHFPIKYARRDYFKTTREKYNESLYDYRTNPGKSLRNTPLAPKDAKGNTLPIARRRLFFNPLEKE